MSTPHQPLTPVMVEAKLRQLVTDMTKAQQDLAAARDEEVRAKHDFERAHRRALLSGDCPKVTRGGYTTAERDAWVSEQCAEIREMYELAEVRRKAAEDHLRTLFQQGVIASALAKSVGQAFHMAGVVD